MLRTLPVGIFESSGRPLPSMDAQMVATLTEASLWTSTLAARQSARITAVVAIVIALAVGGMLLASGLTAVAIVLVLIAMAVGGLSFIRSGTTMPAQRVVSVRRVYWPVIVMPLENAAIAYDAADIGERETIDLPLVNRPDELHAAGEAIRALLNRTRVLEPENARTYRSDTTFFGTDADLLETTRKVEDALKDISRVTIEAPALKRDDAAMTALASLSSSLQSADCSPVLARTDGLPLAVINSRIEGLENVARSASSFDLDDELTTLSEALSRVSADLRRRHDDSFTLLAQAEALATYTTSCAALDFYCRFCNSVTTDGDVPLSAATRLLLDVSIGGFECPTCRRTLSDADAILINRFHQEIFLPAFDQICLSMRSELLAIDRDVENQLVQLEKEQNVKIQEVRMQVQQEHRKRVAQLRSQKAQASALKHQVAGMTAALLKYQKLAAGRAEAYQRDCERIEADVRQRCDAAVARIRKENESRQQQADAESERLIKIRKEEAERRHREQIEQLQRMNETQQAQLEVQKRAAEFQEKQAKLAAMTPEQREALQPAAIWTPATAFKRWQANSGASNVLGRIE